MRLLLSVSALIALAVVGAGVFRDGGPSSRLELVPRGGPLASDAGQATIGTEPRRRGVSGRLVEVSPDGVTLQTADEQIFVRFAEETRFCRRGCEANWRDLRPGDLITASAVLGLGETVRVADWVDANVTAGYGEVVAVDGDALAVVLSRPGQPSKLRTLLLEPYTRVRGANGKDGEAGGIEVGDSFYFTGSGDTPDASSLWVYGFWENF
jgi:hypothetical protein